MKIHGSDVGKLILRTYIDSDLSICIPCLSRRRIATWSLLAEDSKLVENFPPSNEYSPIVMLTIIVYEYSQRA